MEDPEPKSIPQPQSTDETCWTALYGGNFLADRMIIKFDQLTITFDALGGQSMFGKRNSLVII